MQSRSQDVKATSRNMNSVPRVGCCCVHLWGGDDDGSIDASAAEILHDGQMLIRCSWRRVYDQIIQFSPVHIPQKLFYHA